MYRSVTIYFECKNLKSIPKIILVNLRLFLVIMADQIVFKKFSFDEFNILGKVLYVIVEKHIIIIYLLY